MLDGAAGEGGDHGLVGPTHWAGDGDVAEVAHQPGGVERVGVDDVDRASFHGAVQLVEALEHLEVGGHAEVALQPGVDDEPAGQVLRVEVRADGEDQRHDVPSSIER